MGKLSHALEGSVMQAYQLSSSKARKMGKISHNYFFVKKRGKSPNYRKQQSISALYQLPTFT
jgi:hypothetical protein